MGQSLCRGSVLVQFPAAAESAAAGKGTKMLPRPNPFAPVRITNRCKSFPAERPTAVCRCGFPRVNAATTTNRDMVMHLAGCHKNGGPTKRHHLVRDALAGIMTRAGYITQTEVALDPKGEFRMDIVATPPNGKALYIDTTVANSASRSYASTDINKVFGAKDEGQGEEGQVPEARGRCWC